MLDIALKSKIPVIATQTDDLVNVLEVLRFLAGKVTPLPTNKNVYISPNSIYWTRDSEDISDITYKELEAAHTSAVLINPEKPCPFAFDAGALEVPAVLLSKRLEAIVPPESLDAMVAALKGLSIKKAMEVASLTMASTGSLTVKGINRTRRFIEGSAPGLEALDTNYPFYSACNQLQEWVSLNRDYYLDPSIPAKLVPKGLMLSGVPGVGKTMASMYLARCWDIPLFRLDLTSALSKYIGESERHIASLLRQVDESSPCVLLIDEVNKLFGDDGDNGTTQRILSQLLWWLQYHTSRVITVMTTNNIEVIPPELYRPGRLDEHIEIPMLTMAEAKVFAAQVLKTLEPEHSIHKLKVVRDAFEGAGMIAHSKVEETVITLIKKKGWMAPEKVVK